MSKIQVSEYNSKDRWCQFTEQEKYCDSCYCSKGGAFFLADKESICLSCAVKEMKHGVSNLIESLFSESTGLEPLLNTELISSRLGILLNLDKIRQVIAEIDDEDDQEVLKQNIVLSLGFACGHPLDHFIRTITLRLLIASGDLFSDILLDFLDAIDDPYDDLYDDQESFDRQKFRYNLAHTLVHVDKKNGYVQEFIREVIDEAEARDDLFVNRWFSFHNDIFSPRIPLEYNSHTISRLADEYILKVIDSGSYRDLVENKEEQDNKRKKLRLAYIIDQTYSLPELKMMHKKYFGNLCQKTGEPASFNWPEKAYKQDYVQLFCDVLSNDKLITAFLSELELWIRETLELVAWGERNPLVSDLEKKYNLEIFSNAYADSYFNINKVISKNHPFFCYHSESVYYGEELNPSVYLPFPLKVVLKTLLPKPVNSRLRGRDVFAEDLFLSAPINAVGQINNLITYINQVGIKRGKNGKNILKATSKEVSDFCQIEEPYKGDKTLAFLKGTILIELLEDETVKEIDSKLTPDEIYKEIFSRLFFKKDEEDLFNYVYFLKYLKDWGFHEYTEDKEVRIAIESLAIKTLLKELPSGKWVTIENIIVYLNSKNIFPYPYTLETNVNRASFSSQGRYGSQLTDIDDTNWSEAILIPYLKTLLFILHSFGAVDLALEYPENSRYHDKKNPWLSPYDGVREVSITPIGEWLMGRREKYENEGVGLTSKIILDEKRLLIAIEGDNPAALLTLNRIGESLGNGCYLVTAASFLSFCNIKRDLKEKIKMFRKNISSNPPAIWEEFLTSLLHKADPLKHKKVERFIFQLDREDKELIGILFSDPLLKSLVMKAEDYHILIKNKDYKAVQSRLAVLGYLLPPKNTFE